MSEKPVQSIEVDPHLETADVDRSNNYFPPKIQKSRFQLYQEGKTKNEMQKAGLGKKAEPEVKADPKSAAKDQSKDQEEPKKEVKPKPQPQDPAPQDKPEKADSKANKPDREAEQKPQPEKAAEPSADAA